MITFLSSPKPFIGTANNNQLNAIRSWLNVHPEVEVILYGASAGCGEASAALGVRNVSEIETSPSGVPYFDAIARHAQKYARYDVQVYLNSDILVNSRIIDVLKNVNFPKFLIVGQRIDLPSGAIIPEGKDSWGTYLNELVKNGVELSTPSAMDYFIFTRGLWEGLKPLVIGRGGYDSALIGFCLGNNIPVIDATYFVPVLHQYHDYSHVKGKQSEVMAGIDARENRKTHKIEHSAPNTADATWQIYNDQLIPNNSRGDWLRHLEIFLRYRKKMVFLSFVIRAVWRVLTGAGVYKESQVRLRDVIRN